MQALRNNDIGGDEVERAVKRYNSPSLFGRVT